MNRAEWEAALQEAERAEKALQTQGKAPLPDEDIAKLEKQGLDEARAVVREFAPRPRSMGEAVAQGLRVATSTIADPIRAGVATLTGEETFRNNLALERAETRLAQESVERVSNAPLGAAKMATNIAALTAATPAAAVSTPGAGLLFGAGTETARQGFQTYEEEGRLPTTGEAIGAAGRGGAAAGIGMLVGSGINFAVNLAMRRGKQVPEQLMRYIEKTERAENLASQKMQKANVQLSDKYIQRLASRIDGVLIRAGVTPTSAPRTWEAVNTLRSRATQGGDVSLMELNNIRRQIRDFEIGEESYGGIKTAVDQINKAINGVAITKAPGVVVKGNPQLGVSAWNSLNRNHIQTEKANVLVKMARNAEQLSRENGWSIHRALQKQASRFINRNDVTGGKALGMFSKEEQTLLHDISNGTGVGNAMNRMDAKIGHGAFRAGFDWTAGLTPQIVANTAARNKMQNAVDNIVYSTPAMRGVSAPLLAAPALGELMNPTTPINQPPLPAPIPLASPQEESKLPPTGLDVQKLLPGSQGR